MRATVLNVNGTQHELELEPRELLVYVLRDRLGLTGTNVGCDTSACGACTVLMNGESVKSCTVLGVQAAGAEITTIEGLAQNGELHPVQQAFHEHHALQCGYCTPGMVMAAVSLIEHGEGDRRGCGADRPGGKPLPLHRLSEHRPGGSLGRRERVMSATETFIGQPMKRKEDRALLLGQGTYVDNMNVTGQLVMAVVRSPYARARITSIDTSAAKAAEGVVAVFTGADLREDWKSPLPCAWPVTEEMRAPEHFPLAIDEARYQGDGVAVVLAESRALAQDAAELVDVAYEPLPAAVEVGASLEDGSPLVHEPFGTNECYVWTLATDDVDDVFAKADVTVSHTYYQPRLIPNAIEPRAVLAEVGAGGDVTVHSATQVPHILRFGLALVLGIDEARVRVIAPDVGGGFGSKLDVYAEEALAVALARRLRRPVKWTEERVGGLSGDDSRT